MKYTISSVCRANPELVGKIMQSVQDKVDLQKGVQVIPIATDLVESRAVTIKYDDKTKPIACVLKPHRDSFIPCISMKQAEELVANGIATYENSNALIYSKQRYLNDSQVPQSEKDALKDMDIDIVFVAVINNVRSLLASVRNMIDGQQANDLEELKISFSARNTFLIED